jgi:hypothetical protein
MSEATTPDRDPFALTGRQRFWMIAFWASLVLTIVLLAGGFLGVTLGLIEETGGGDLHRDVNFANPKLIGGAVMLVVSWGVELFGVRVAKKRRPITRRMAKKIERLAERSRSQALGGSIESLIVMRTLTPELHGRMWRTQLVVRSIDRAKGVVIVALPALGLKDGRERRFAVVLSKAPAWLATSHASYRLHARVNIGDLEETTGWGYVTDFEPDHVGSTRG